MPALPCRTALALIIAAVCASSAALPARDLSDVASQYRPRLETNLLHNIIPFWHPNTLDQIHGGYLLNHDLEGRFQDGGSKMIVTQARMVWFYSRLARAGYGRQYLDAADVGYRFLRDRMWDEPNGGFYWEVDRTGTTKLRPGKHLYGQSFALYALAEYHRASGKPEPLELATRLFDLLEAKAHDPVYGGYQESFNEDWSPVPAGAKFYMEEAGLKLMNTHLHLLESLTCFYRASELPRARSRLLELIAIQSRNVVRKEVGACTDRHRRNWEPVLADGGALVSYGHDLENIWLLIDACNAADISNQPLVGLYQRLFDYSLKYGFDERHGGFFDSGDFELPARNRNKSWWVQAEACVSALYLYRLTRDAEYLRVFERTYDWIDQHQVDWKRGEWFETIKPSGAPAGGKAHLWKAGYHNGRAMIECLEILKAKNLTAPGSPSP